MRNEGVYNFVCICGWILEIGIRKEQLKKDLQNNIQYILHHGTPIHGHSKKYVLYKNTTFSVNDTTIIQQTAEIEEKLKIFGDCLSYKIGVLTKSDPNSFCIIYDEKNSDPDTIATIMKLYRIPN